MAFAPLIAIGMSVAAAAVSAYGQYSAGQSTKQWSDYNAAVQRNDAALTLAGTEEEARRKKASGASLLAKQRVLYAKAGVETAGTPEEVIIGTAGDVAADADLITQRGIYAYQRGTEEATLSEAQGEAAAQAGTLQAEGTLLTGLGKSGLAATGLSIPGG